MLKEEGKQKLGSCGLLKVEKKKGWRDEGMDVHGDFVRAILPGPHQGVLVSRAVSVEDGGLRLNSLALLSFR